MFRTHSAVTLLTLLIHSLLFSVVLAVPLASVQRYVAFDARPNELHTPNTPLTRWLQHLPVAQKESEDSGNVHKLSGKQDSLNRVSLEKPRSLPEDALLRIFAAERTLPEDALLRIFAAERETISRVHTTRRKSEKKSASENDISSETSFLSNSADYNATPQQEEYFPVQLVAYALAASLDTLLADPETDAYNSLDYLLAVTPDTSADPLRSPGASRSRRGRRSLSCQLKCEHGGTLLMPMGLFDTCRCVCPSYTSGSRCERITSKPPAHVLKQLRMRYRKKLLLQQAEKEEQVKVIKMEVKVLQEQPKDVVPEVVKSVEVKSPKPAKVKKVKKIKAKKAKNNKKKKKSKLTKKQKMLRRAEKKRLRLLKKMKMKKMKKLKKMKKMKMHKLRHKKAKRLRLLL